MDETDDSAAPLWAPASHPDRTSDEASDGAPDGVAASEASDDLYTSLLDGMHAMAQPLTLLQSRIHLALWQEADERDQEPMRAGKRADWGAANRGVAGLGVSSLGVATQGVADLGVSDLGAAADIDELCRLFGLMQELLQVRSVPARLRAIACAGVTRALAETAEAVFACSGVEIDLDLEAARTRAGLLLELDLARTQRALSSLLLVARELAGPGSVVSCTAAPAFADTVADASPSKGWIECRIAASSCQGVGEAALPGYLRLHLALARQCLVSQQGRLSISLVPFGLIATLPLLARSEHQAAEP